MNNKRILWLDYARTFAICSVLLVHSAEYAYSLKPEEILKLGTASSLIRLVSIVIGRLGVPIFLMLSGYLLLDRDYSNGEKIKKFYKRNLLPLVLTVEVWIIIYYIYLTVFNKQDFILIDFIKDLLFLKDNAFGHFWYMPMIIGLYIVLPFVANAIKNIDLKIIAIPFTVLCFTVFALKTISVFDTAYGGELNLVKKVFTDFSGGAYGAYILMGYFVKKKAFCKIKTWILAAGTLLFGVFTGYTLIFSLRNGYDYHLWYDFAGVFLCSIFIFEMFSRINSENRVITFFGKFATSVSVLSLGMYFIHKPILSFIRFRILKFELYRPVNLILFFVIIFAVSYILSFIISKIPKIRKLLILVKD